MKGTKKPEENIEMRRLLSGHFCRLNTLNERIILSVLADLNACSNEQQQKK